MGNKGPQQKGSDFREGEAPAEPLPVRCHPSHGILEVPNQPTIVFLTVCTEKRLPWLATPDHHALLRSIWSEATAWRTGRCMLLPDHLHLFAAPGATDFSFENWVKYWKSQFRKKNTNKA
jgi:putative transposase